MSKIPFAQVQGDGVVSVGTPPMQSLELGTGLGKGLETLGQSIGVVADVADKMAQARESQDVGNKLVDSNGQLDIYRQQLDSDPDYANREKKFIDKRQQLLADQTKTLSSQRAIDDFTLRFNQLSGTMQMQVRHEARDQENQNFRIDLSDSLGKLGTQAAFAKSDPERQAIQDEANKQIISAVQTGRLTGVQGNQFRKAFLSHVDAAVAGEMVRLNPGAAIAALGDPDKFKYLDAATRVQLRTQATVRAEALSVQARAEARQDGAIILGAIHAGQDVRKEDVDAYLRRVGPGSVMGVTVQRAYDFGIKVKDATAGKTVPELQQDLLRLQVGAGNVKTHDGYPAPVTPTGQVMTELGMTVQDQRLNNGKPTNIPSLWEAKPRDQEEAIQFALKSGKTFPSFDTIEQAVQASIEKSDAKGRAIAAQGSSPADLALARAIEKEVHRRSLALKDDPNAYVMGRNPDLTQKLQDADQAAQQPDEAYTGRARDLRRQARAAQIEAQRAEGVPEHRITLLTDTQAEGLKQYLNNQELVDRVNTIRGLRADYGAEWPRIAAQLWKGHPTAGPTEAEEQLSNQIQAGLVQKQKALTQDSASYVLNQYPAVQDKFRQADEAASSADPAIQAQAASLRQQGYAGMIDAQRNEGLPEHKINLLTDRQADVLRNRFLNAQGQQMIDLTATLRSEYGAEWPRVQAQLWQGKPAPLIVQVSGDLPPGANFTATELAEAMKMTEDDAKKLLGGESIKAVHDAVTSGSADMQGTLNLKPGGPQFSAEYVKGAEHLALWYMTRDKIDANTAAQRALDGLYYKHWEIVGTTRVPKLGGQPVVPAYAVRGTQQLIMNSLDVMPLLMPAGQPGQEEATKAAFISTIRSSGLWVTTDDHKAMVLLAGNGIPVRFSDGTLVQVPWEAVQTQFPTAGQPAAGLPAWWMSFARQANKSGVTPVTPDLRLLQGGRR